MIVRLPRISSAPGTMSESPANTVAPTSTTSATSAKPSDEVPASSSASDASEPLRHGDPRHPHPGASSHKPPVIHDPPY
jgi:hypothetical protein